MAEVSGCFLFGEPWEGSGAGGGGVGGFGTGKKEERR